MLDGQAETDPTPSTRPAAAAARATTSRTCSTRARPTTASTSCTSTATTARSTATPLRGTPYAVRRPLPAARGHRDRRARTPYRPAFVGPPAHHARPGRPGGATRAERTTRSMVERIGYDTALNGRLTVFGLGGNDYFATDDTTVHRDARRRRGQRHVPDRPALRPAARCDGADRPTRLDDRRVARRRRRVRHDRDDPRLALGGRERVARRAGRRRQRQLHGLLQPGAAAARGRRRQRPVRRPGLRARADDRGLPTSRATCEIVWRDAGHAGRDAAARARASSRPPRRPTSAPAPARTRCSTTSTRPSRSRAATASTRSWCSAPSSPTTSSSPRRRSTGRASRSPTRRIEILEIDGLEGDDIFDVLSTAPGVATRVIGGLGSRRHQRGRRRDGQRRLPRHRGHLERREPRRAQRRPALRRPPRPGCRRHRRARQPGSGHHRGERRLHRRARGRGRGRSPTPTSSTSPQRPDAQRVRHRVGGALVRRTRRPRTATPCWLVAACSPRRRGLRPRRRGSTGSSSTCPPTRSCSCSRRTPGTRRAAQIVSVMAADDDAR